MTMELSRPKAKKNCTMKKQPAFPIFIESELGITIDNWVAITYTGIFNGYSVEITSPEEISALYSMGNFGKGSLSRSKPSIMKKNNDISQFIRRRQYDERNKWVPEKPPPIKTELSDREEEILNLQKSIEKLKKTLDEASKAAKSNTIDISSDDSEDEYDVDVVMTEPSSGNCPSTSSGNTKDAAKKSNRQNNPKNLNSVVVLPDSDSENDDYFTNLNPQLYNDDSSLKEKLILNLQEAYFLAYGLGCLEILDRDKKQMTLGESWKKFCECERGFAEKYIVYHYFRSKGWIVKPGIKFGGQYILYKEGQDFYHATYIVLYEVIEDVKTHKSKFDWTNILGIMRMATTAVKEVIIAQVCVPSDAPLSKLREDPTNISKYTVHEVLFRRWQSNSERNENAES